MYGICYRSLCCAFLAGCSGQEQQNGVMEYTDVQADAETILDNGDHRHIVGTQFYQGDAVQICTSRNDDKIVDIYLYREDEGSYGGKGGGLYAVPGRRAVASHPDSAAFGHYL